MLQMKRMKIMCTKGIRGQVSIDTLDWYPWAAFDWHLINTWSTLHVHLNWHSIDTRPTSDWLLIECQSSVNRDVNWMLIKCQSRCWLDVDQVPIDQGLIDGIDRHSAADSFNTYMYDLSLICKMITDPNLTTWSNVERKLLEVIPTQ